MPVLAALAFGLASPARAALATDQDAAQHSEADADAQHAGQAGLGAAAAPPETPGDSKTVRMLLELQSAPPPLEGMGDARGAGSAQRPGQQTATDPGSQQSAPANTVPSQAGVQPAVDWRSGLTGRTGGNPTMAAPTAAADLRQSLPGRTQTGAAGNEPLKLRIWVPTALIQFVRQNREWILGGGLLLLAVVWVGASAAASQRRR